MNYLTYQTNIHKEKDAAFVISLLKLWLNNGFHINDITIENSMLKMWNSCNEINRKQVEEVITICGFQFKQIVE